jgi:hypothetical protein
LGQSMLLSCRSPGPPTDPNSRGLYGQVSPGCAEPEAASLQEPDSPGAKRAGLAPEHAEMLKAILRGAACSTMVVRV